MEVRRAISSYFGFKGERLKRISVITVLTVIKVATGWIFLNLPNH